MFKVGDRVVVRKDSRFAHQREFGEAVIEHVRGPGHIWDVLVRYKDGYGLNYKFCDLDRVRTFKGNIK